MTERAIERSSDPRPGGRLLFGSGLDPVSNGSKGGKASHAQRRFREQRKIEQAIFDRSKNGYALLRLAELEAKRNRDLEDARIRADSWVNSLMDDADREREIIARLREQTHELEAQVQVLEERRQQASLDDDALDALLRDVGVERASESAVRLGWDSDDVVTS